jgi:hypothetical protein
MNKIDAISEVCRALSRNSRATAIETLAAYYLFAPKPLKKLHCTPLQSTRVFVRDGFIDRYSGDKLVFPPVFRVISLAIPEHFPFHPNWKTDVTHPAYWEMGATIDHHQALSVGGGHNESNWYTTSMARNAAKMNWTLDQLGWRLHDRGDMNKWDGLLGWFLEYTDAHPEIFHADVLEIQSVRQWLSAAKQVMPSA